MESAQIERLKINYVVYTKVTGMLERFKKVHVEGVGDKAIFNDVSLGWFVQLEGSHEAVNLGKEKPSLTVGDPIRITIEKV